MPPTGGAALFDETRCFWYTSHTMSTTKNAVQLRLGGAILLLAAVALALAGCHARPLLSDVSVSPNVISPNADGHDDATNIAYNLTRPATVSIYFQDAAGQHYYFRRDRERAAGDYRVQWGGVINQVRWVDVEGQQARRQRVESWVLPDGTYTWVVAATGEDGLTAASRGEIVLSGGDHELPTLTNFTVALPTFSPNQDGLDDRTGVGYYLNKVVDGVQVYVYDPAEPSVRYPLEEQGRDVEPGQPGYHYYDYDGGVDRGADPPADGRYVVQAEARDLAGHHVVVSSTLTIVNGGVPRASVVKGTIHWGDVQRGLEGTEIYLPLGATLVFTTYIENYGTVPLRTAGPPSGIAYRSDQNFNTLAGEMNDPSFHEQAGVWRFGIRFDTSNTDFPYRWAIGRPDELRCETIDGRQQCFLDPGKRGTVTGSIQLVGPFPREAIYAWGALIHEYVGIDEVNNYVDRVLMHIGEP